MKVKDLIKEEIDVDVYDNVCEELAIAFCGSVELTEYGKKHFHLEILGYFEDYNSQEVSFIQKYNSLAPCGYNVA